MQVVKYKIDKSILTVGFKENEFVVYSQITYDNAKTKAELLQIAYIQVKHTIDYEKTQLEHSLVTDIVGEDFIPGIPKATILELTTDKTHLEFEKFQENLVVNLASQVKDQFGDIFVSDIVLTTDYGTITDGVLNIPKVTQLTPITITANMGILTVSLIIYVKDFVTPPKTDIELLQEENEALKIRVVETEKTVANNTNDQQQLLELLIDMEII